MAARSLRTMTPEGQRLDGSTDVRLAPVSGPDSRRSLPEPLFEKRPLRFTAKFRFAWLGIAGAWTLIAVVSTWHRPLGGTVAFPRLKLPIDTQRMVNDLATQEGVLLLPGRIFDWHPSFFRIGFGRRDFPQALEGFARYLERARREPRPHEFAVSGR